MTSDTPTPPSTATTPPPQRLYAKLLLNTEEILEFMGRHPGATFELCVGGVPVREHLARCKPGWTQQWRSERGLAG